MLGVGVSIGFGLGLVIDAIEPEGGNFPDVAEASHPQDGTVAQLPAPEGGQGPGLVPAEEAVVDGRLEEDRGGLPDLLGGPSAGHGSCCCSAGAWPAAGQWCCPGVSLTSLGKTRGINLTMS